MEYEISKGWYSNCRDHELGKPLLRAPFIGGREISIERYRNIIKEHVQRHYQKNIDFACLV